MKSIDAIGLWLAALLLLSSVQARASNVVDIATDARFETAVAEAGMARPAEFSARGVYTSAPVDPSKDVVLFVHGARGTPRDFLEVAKDLDATRQQAWFAYYATGQSIAESGHALAADVLEKMNRHGITRIRVFAHSMGGLVAREAIAELEQHVTVLQFVSVNTPWGGDPAARVGAWFSPSPLPIWVDLAPGSKALTAIRRQTLEAPFTLVYTVMEDSQRSTGDGTVSRDSQTPPAMTQQAASIVREIGTHMSVLHGRTAERLSLLLEAQ